MKAFLRKVLFYFGLLGLDPLRAIRTAGRLPRYFRDLHLLRQQAKTADDDFPVSRFYPCLEDRGCAGGSGRGSYFHQDLLVARRIFQRRPDVHLDVGSRVDGFVAHVAVFREITVADIRPNPSDIPNVSFIQADMMEPVVRELNGFCDSLSCLHALEHFGLGRYGDPVLFDGHLRGLKNFYRMLKPGGMLYLSVPIGRQRIEFNAHRVFSVDYLLSLLESQYTLKCFSYVDDDGNLHENSDMVPAATANNFGCRYGCGIFELQKRLGCLNDAV